MALMSRSMDGTSGDRGNRNSNSNSSSISLGVNRHSSKISKPLKRTSSGAAPLQQQVSKQPPPPPVYNINKNDFRNVVQRLTGSPLPERYDPCPPPLLPAAVPVPPASNPKPPNSRLHKIRPPPLSALGSAAPPPPPMLRSPQFMNFSPLPPLTPGDAVWAGNIAMESPVTRYMKYLQDPVAGGGGFGGAGAYNPSPRGMQLQQRPAAPLPALLPSPRRPPPQLPLPSPTSQYLLPSPLPSPGSFLSLPSPGLFPLNFFTQSPSGQFGFPGGGPSLPPSPGVLFPLQSPTSARFRLTSPRWRDSDMSFTFPDPDRRL